MSKTLFSENLEQLNSIAKQILDYTSTHKKFAFYGEMGVGKTSLIKALSLHLGVLDAVSSPTFSIVNEYQADENTKIYHFDFYRIEDEKEAYDMGYEEYFFSNAYCFIEWSEKIPNLIEEDMVQIKMSVEGNKRRIELII
ncbi:MAG: tRNA threonylcarbamoyladenosine biosynthesis protein TsaE [Cryomorphaceae bacterium]|nr:MAG: tRNA threonylcarbamoyladenosine biosynthesis protein TsaE [Cryomorphaceae bacterium]